MCSKLSNHKTVTMGRPAGVVCRRPWLLSDPRHIRRHLVHATHFTEAWIYSMTVFLWDILWCYQWLIHFIRLYDATSQSTIICIFTSVRNFLQNILGFTYYRSLLCLLHAHLNTLDLIILVTASEKYNYEVLHYEFVSSFFHFILGPTDYGM
jgi:hypothetical protein